MRTSLGGYWIWSTHLAAVGHARSASLPVANGDWVLLATDGLMRLVDVFGVEKYDTLIESVRNTGLRELVSRVRELEARDPNCEVFPRVHKEDDATAILLRVRQG